MPTVEVLCLTFTCSRSDLVHLIKKIRNNLCPQNIITQSAEDHLSFKAVINAPSSGLDRERIIHSQLCFLYVCWKTAEQSRPLLPQFIKCSPVRAPGWREQKREKHQTEILNILHWLNFILIRFYQNQDKHWKKRGKPSGHITVSLFALVGMEIQSHPFLAGHLQRQHLEFSFHFKYLLKPLIGRRVRDGVFQ